MTEIRGTNQAIRYLTMLGNIKKYGCTVYPRGLECRELEDCTLIVDSRWPFMTFISRNYDINYFKREMRWKLGANKYDKSIQDSASTWKTMINPDGTYNSNYGQFWFGEQHGIWDVVTELVRDPSSRKAVIPMLNVSHMSSQTVDTVCTECVGFRLRPVNGALSLNMSVHMRSSDVIYGLGTDIPTFAFLHRLVHGLLDRVVEPTMMLRLGTITITAMSSHIYARHYDMVDRILSEGTSGYAELLMPYCDHTGATQIIASRGKDEKLLRRSSLGAWLCS